VTARLGPSSAVGAAQRRSARPGPSSSFSEGTFNAAVERALEANAARLKELHE
jgi:hypothetical protein